MLDQELTTKLLRRLVNTVSQSQRHLVLIWYNSLVYIDIQKYLDMNKWTPRKEHDILPLSTSNMTSHKTLLNKSDMVAYKPKLQRKTRRLGGSLGAIQFPWCPKHGMQSIWLTN